MPPRFPAAHRTSCKHLVAKVCRLMGRKFRLAVFLRVHAAQTTLPCGCFEASIRVSPGFSCSRRNAVRQCKGVEAAPAQFSLAISKRKFACALSLELDNRKAKYRKAAKSAAPRR